MRDEELAAAPEEQRRPVVCDGGGAAPGHDRPRPDASSADRQAPPVERPMPSAVEQHGRGAAALLLLAPAAVVACIYIGIPLLLFTHDFSHRLVADAGFAVTAFAAVLGGVLRGLRRTTRHSGPVVPMEAEAASTAAPIPDDGPARGVRLPVVVSATTVGD